MFFLFFLKIDLSISILNRNTCIMKYDLLGYMYINLAVNTLCTRMKFKMIKYASHVQQNWGRDIQTSLETTGASVIAS
jgi:hypothetical protein